MSHETFERWLYSPNNRSAFEAWYSEVNGRLLLQSYRVTGGDRQEAEDLLHTVVVKFLDQNLVIRMTDEPAAIAYILTAVRNLWFDQISRENKGKNFDTRGDLQTGNTPVEMLLLEDRLQSIESGLEIEERETLWRMIEGKSLSEIASEEGISYSNSGVRVHRIREKIKELLGE